MSSLALSDDIFSRYEPARVFMATSNVFDSDRSLILSPVTCFDFEPVESTLALAAHGHRNSLTLFNVQVGVIIQRFTRVASEGGLTLAKFSRRVGDSSCLVAPKVSPSDTLSYAVRAYSLIQSSTIRTFPGHAQQICSLSVSPIDETFVTCDNGGELRVWDMRQTIGCIGRLRIPARSDAGRGEDETFAAYHPDGTTLACLQSTSGTIRLFNLRNLEKGPVRILSMPTDVRFGRPLIVGAQADPVSYIDIQFSPSGDMLLVTSDQNLLVALNFQTGRLLFQCDCISKKGSPAIPSFSADGRFLAVNGTSGPLIFRCSDGQLLTALDVGAVCSTSRICCFSPKTELLVSTGDDATVLWTEKVS